jgi:thiamine biosynthesis lipoprotein
VGKNLHILIASAIFIVGCSNSPELHSIAGEAQGTTYSIKYTGDQRVTQQEVDSVIEAMDIEMNLWRPESRINAINSFNREDTVFAFYDSSKIWSVLWDMTWEINQETFGAFDPTVMPLVELWGFGLSNTLTVDSLEVDSIMSFVGFRTDLIDMDEVENDTAYLETHFIKGDSRSRLDFNAIAQGYTVDLLIDLLDYSGVENAMVELGGEVRCMGKNQEGRYWNIAIDKPVEGSSAQDREFQAIVEVKDASICTSGNYRKFIEIDGVKRSHSIDPRTGYPVDHNLLSVTIKARSAALADAYATACMVLGPEEGMYLIGELNESGAEVDALFIMSGTTNELEYWVSPGWEEEITWLK